MTDFSPKDRLTIETENSQINLDVTFGFLDRSFSAFNFKSQKNEEVNGYNLSIDAENLDNSTMKELDEISNQLEKLHDITLVLDGFLTEGKAKIAKKFGIGEFNLDLEIHAK